MKNKTTDNISEDLYFSGADHSVQESSWIQCLCRKAVFRLLSRCQYDRITIVDTLGKQTFGAISDKPLLDLTIWVHDLNLYWRVMVNGSVGVAESYMKGEWNCSDLLRLTRFFALNLKVLDDMETGIAHLGGWLGKGWYFFRKNTVRGSEVNISAHYDLSNEFFQSFLDPSMTYSSVFFEQKHISLEEAAWNKNDRVCKKLNLKPTDHLLEIGTGWGSFAIHAAQHYGCRVTTTTISTQQYELAVERVKQAGLSEYITLLQKDYRHLDGNYDKLVSIEMIEAVGYQFFDQYFQICNNLLKPEGMLLLQAITIDDRQYKKAKKSVDFIQRYIFPGGSLPSLASITESVKHSTNMRLFHMEDLASHYAMTLRKWRENFNNNIDQVRKLGFSDEFIRMWEYYFCYCEGGFTERVIGCLQILLTKPMCRRDSITGGIS